MPTLDGIALAAQEARGGGVVGYYHLTAEIDKTFDAARAHAATPGERTALERGRAEAQEAARGYMRGKGPDPSVLAENVRRAIRDGGTPSWHDEADATGIEAIAHMRRVAGL